MREKWLSRNLIVLSLVSFFQDAASEMLYPVLPIFLTTVLGAPIAVVGVIEGLAEAISSLTKLISGRLADRFRRRPLVGIGYGLAAFAKLIIAFASTWPVVLLARAIDRTGKGIRSAPRDTLIADDADPRYMGRAFGFHRAADTAGAVIGPAIGLLLYRLFDHDIRKLLIFAVIPATISAFFVFFVRERPHTTNPSIEQATKSFLGQRYWRVTIPVILFSFVNFTDALLILRARYLGLSVSAVIAAYMLYNLSYSLLSYPAGSLSDRIPRNRVFAIGIAVFALTYISLGLIHTSAWVWPIFILYGAFTALTDGVGKAWIADLVEPQVRGRAMGNFQGLTGLASIVAGTWAGFTWNSSGQFPLIVAGSVALLTVPAFLFIDRAK